MKKIGVKFSLLLFCGLLFAGSASAGIVVDKQAGNESSTSWQLFYTPRKAIISSGSTSSAIPEFQNQLAAPREIGSRRESAAISVPGMDVFDPGEWSATFPDGGPDDVDVEFSSATVAGVPTAIVTLFPRGDEAAGITILITRKLPHNSGSREQTDRTFTPRTVQAPVASHKALFRETLKGTVQSIDASANNGARLLYHGSVIARGGVSDQKLWFFVPTSPTSVSEFEAVMLTPGAANPSPASTTRNAFETLSAASAEVEQVRTKLFEPDLVYDRATALPLGERFTAYRIVGTQLVHPTQTTTLQIDDVVTSNQLHLTVNLVAVTDIINTTPDHYATLSLDGYVEEYSAIWDDAQLYTAELDFPQEGKRSTMKSRGPMTAGLQLKLNHTIYSGGSISTDGQGLNSVEVTWHGMPRVDAQRRCTVSIPQSASPKRATIGGFPLATSAADVLLLDVTNENAPVLISNPSMFNDETGTRAIEFEVPATASRVYAQLYSDLAQPLAVIPTKSLPAVAAPLRALFIAPEELALALQPLIAYRGTGCYYVDAAAAYDCYGQGQESAEAIRMAARDLIGSLPAQSILPSIVLAGSATFDVHNHLGLKTGAQIPTYIGESVPATFGSSVMIENCVDATYGNLFGGDDIPDAMVGRLPARTPAELTAMINRIVAHAQIAPALSNQSRPAVFTTDYDPTTVSPDAYYWPTIWEPTDRPHQVVDALDFVTTDSITLQPVFNSGSMNSAVHAAFEQQPAGPVFFFYFGHGNYNVWGPSGGQYFTASDIASINTFQKWPIVLTFTCFNGYYTVPGAPERALAEQWLLQPIDHGAVANIATGGIDYYDSQRLFSIKALELLAMPIPQRPKTIGELMARTRTNFALEYPDLQKTNDLYLLFGDPLTTLTMSPTGSGFSLN